MGTLACLVPQAQAAGTLSTVFTSSEMEDTSITLPDVQSVCTIVPQHVVSLSRPWKASSVAK
jgi:hypothetical protein